MLSAAMPGTQAPLTAAHKLLWGWLQGQTAPAAALSPQIGAHSRCPRQTRTACSMRRGRKGGARRQGEEGGTGKIRCMTAQGCMPALGKYDRPSQPLSSPGRGSGTQAGRAHRRSPSTAQPPHSDSLRLQGLRRRQRHPAAAPAAAAATGRETISEAQKRGVWRAVKEECSPNSR